MSNNNNFKANVGNTGKPVIPVPVHRLVLTVFNNGKMSVAGIPPSLKVAIGMLYDANVSICNHFVEKAKAGELDENNDLIKSNIVKPGKKPILV